MTLSYICLKSPRPSPAPTTSAPTTRAADIQPSPPRPCRRRPYRRDRLPARHVQLEHQNGREGMALGRGSRRGGRPRPTWETGGVTDMSYLFAAIHVLAILVGATTATGAHGPSTRTSARGTPRRHDHGTRRAAYARPGLGWCVDDDVDLRVAFSGTQCWSTSCGVVQNAEHLRPDARTDGRADSHDSADGPDARGRR